MANAIAPYGRIQDVIVNMVLQQPVPSIGFGNLLLLNKISTPETMPKNATVTDGLLQTITDSATGAVYNEYSNIDAVAMDFNSSTKLYNHAATYFTQKYASDRIAVLNYPEGKLQEALGAFWYQDWYFMTFVENDQEDMTLASNIAEVNARKFLFTQEEKVEDFASWEGNDWTVDLIHPMDEAFASGFVGRVGSRTVGSITWKFKEIEGLTPQAYSATDFTGITNHHAIAYVMVNKKPETSEGWTSTGEYIDSLHGDTWVKVSIENTVQEAFQENDKIPYEKSGIDLITGLVYNVLNKAWAQGIILTDDATKKGDFSVTATDRSAQSIQDLSKRHYGGISFTYHRSGAIHSATINGLVKSDTITTPKTASSTK